jgi:hypothetical protein
MWKGCLALLVVLVAAILLELRQIRALELPHAWPAAVVLGVLVTLVVGSIQGIVQAWARRAKPESGPAEWRDGEVVRVGGRLRAGAALLRAPFSGRQAAFYQYWATEVRAETDLVQTLAAFRGMDQTPWELDTAYGRIRLNGIPRMREFLPVNHDSTAIRGEMARHLANVEWRVAPGIWTASLAEGEAALANKNDELPLHLMNGTAVELLEMSPGQRSEEHYRERLATRHWVCQERVIDDGEEVTVVGTYRADAAAIDLGYGAAGRAEHEMVPGGAAETASRNLTTTVVFALVLAALAGAGHYLAYADGGSLYRALIDRLSLGG